MVYRIAQWTVGNVGKAAVEAILEDPRFALVACYTRPGEKTGKDVGELCGIGAIGLAAVSSLEEVLAAKPDLVLYMPLIWDVDAMVQLLEAGVNVISTANFITGYSYGLDEQARLHQAAVRGGVSLFGSGMNPGFANMLALLSTQASRYVTKVTLQESVDASAYDSPDTWRSLGFGGPKDAPGIMEQVRKRALVFADGVEMMAHALQVKLDDIIFEGELGVATEDLDLGYMTIPKGTACGMNLHYIGVSDGRRVIDCGTMTRLGQAMEPDWRPLQGYQFDVEGFPSFRATFHPVRTEESHRDLSGVLAAMPAVNAIAPVIQAKPGLVMAGDLPLIVAAGRVNLGPRS
jgi:hypothetical protein